jgi:hypothetical protein
LVETGFKDPKMTGSEAFRSLKPGSGNAKPPLIFLKQLEIVFKNGR